MGEHEESTAKKILHKLTPGHHDKAAESKEADGKQKITVNKHLEDQDHIHSHASHPMMESYVGSGMHGGIKEFLQCMSEEEAMGVVSGLVRAQAIVGTGAAIREGLNVIGDDAGMEVVGKLVAAQAAVFARASMDPISRQAAREAALEAVTGSYDAVARKLVENPLVPIIGGLLGFLLFAPLVLSLWRFALFGLD